jgi:hypothetical protein
MGDDHVKLDPVHRQGDTIHTPDTTPFTTWRLVSDRGKTWGHDCCENSLETCRT